MFKLSTMVFTTQTGLPNLYAILKYCLNGKELVQLSLDFCIVHYIYCFIKYLNFCFILNNRCRRKLIASHFDESWESTDCNKMCDNCSNPKTVKSICINKYCTDVYKILNAGFEQDTKFTGILYKYRIYLTRP